MGAETRIVHFPDLWMEAQVVGDVLGVIAMLAHSNRQGFQASQQKPGIKRTDAHPDLAESLPANFRHQFLAADQHTGDRIAMTADVFCSAVSDDLSSQLQRTLDYRRREGIVNCQRDTFAPRDFSASGDVDDVKVRIRRGFNKDQLCLFIDRVD